MADEVDRANEVAEMNLRAALKKRLPAGPQANGRCHNCGTHVAGTFCDADCRDDYEHRNIQRNIPRGFGG